MKISISILTLILLLSCNQGNKSASDNEERIEIVAENKAEYLVLNVLEVDSLMRKGLLTKKAYPNMSSCGGSLNGYYYRKQLVFMDATYRGELGYTRKKMYLTGTDFSKILYQEHFPEMEKYKNKHTLDKNDFDPIKVTYADTIYEIKFGPNIEFKKTHSNEIITTKIDSFMINRLVDCSRRMKEELNTVSK